MLGITAYARLAGIVLLVVAAAGLSLFSWDEASIYYHAGLGLLFLFVGFSRLGSATIRQIVGGLGMLLVVVKGAAIFASWMLPIRYLHGPIEIACLIVGVASILAARYLPDRRPFGVGGESASVNCIAGGRTTQHLAYSPNLVEKLSDK